MLPTKTNACPVTVKKESALERAKKRFDAARREQRRTTRIGFIVDATASRSGTWEQAQTIQGRMFRATADVGSLVLRLVHYGGTRLVDNGWDTKAADTAVKMAQVRCETGMTQILPALGLFANEAARARESDGPPQDHQASAIILIGDAFEENFDELERMATALKSAGIKVFSFLEGDDLAPGLAFGRLAEITGGKSAKLGANLPLADLCEGVALLTAGGEKAVRRLENKNVKQLLLPPPPKK